MHRDTLFPPATRPARNWRFPGDTGHKKLDFNYDSSAKELELRNRKLQLPLGSRTTPCYWLQTFAGSKGHLLGASGNAPQGVVRSTTDLFPLAGKVTVTQRQDKEAMAGVLGMQDPQQPRFPKSKGQVRSGH